jgi:hypothetical protein
MRKFLLVYSCYLGAAVLMTWPLVTHISTRLIGHPFGDSYEYTRHIWWFVHALRTGQPLFFQPLLGYPDGLSAAWLWAVPLQSFPAWLLALVLPLATAFNLSALLLLALNGWSAYALVAYLTAGRQGPALLAGLIFMLFPAFQGQLAAGHTGLLVVWPVPLLALALLRLADKPGIRPVLIAAVCFLLSMLGSPLNLIYLTGPITLLLIVQAGVQRRAAAVRRIAAAALLGGALALLFVGPFLLETAGQPARLREDGSVRYSADLLSIVTPSFYHPVFTHLPHTHQVLGIDPFERLGYLGLIAGGLALLGLWSERLARGWLALALAAWVLSLGPLLKVLDTVISLNLGEYNSPVTLPWLLFESFPLLNITRTPARFQFTIGLVLAVLVGYGAAWLWQRLRQAARMPVFGLLAALVIFEYQAFWPLPTVPAVVPEPVRALAQRDDVRAVFDLPWQHLLAQKDGMFLQTGHQKPLIAGQIARRTPVDPAKLTVLQTTLDPALLDREQVDVLILHKTWADDPAAMQAALPGRLLYDDERIAVYEVPPAANALAFQAVFDGDPVLQTETFMDLFAPEPGWAQLSGRLLLGGQTVSLRLNDRLLRVWSGADEVLLDIPLPLPEAGYYRLALTLEPPCPQHFAAALRCREARVELLTVGAFASRAFADSIIFGRGVELAGYSVDADAVQLWWRFAEPLADGDIRFVHILDADGQLVAQDDRSLGPHLPGSSWSETLRFADLPAGIYDVFAGWYTYPDLTRFPVQTDAVGAPDGWAYLGKITVADS